MGNNNASETVIDLSFLDREEWKPHLLNVIKQDSFSFLCNFESKVDFLDETSKILDGTWDTKSLAESIYLVIVTSFLGWSARKVRDAVRVIIIDPFFPKKLKYIRQTSHATAAYSAPAADTVIVDTSGADPNELWATSLEAVLENDSMMALAKKSATKLRDQLKSANVQWPAE